MLSLDCLTLTDCRYEDVIEAAAAAGYDLVSLWLNPLAAFPRQVLPLGEGQACVKRLRDRGIGIHHIEAFDLASVEAIEAGRPYFELGAEVGAKAILFYNGTNPDRDDVVRVLRHACRVAGECGLGVNVEPVSFSGTRTLGDAQRLIADAGVDAGVVLDLLHHVRAGGTAAQIAAMPEGSIRYVQICDGAEHLPEEFWQAEAMSERAYPGDGEFPLMELLRSAPTAVPWGIEVPSLKRRRSGQGSIQQALEAKQAAQVLLSARTGGASPRPPIS
jgi:sugar phosphate isomerase/epimerase